MSVKLFIPCLGFLIVIIHITFNYITFNFQLVSLHLGVSLLFCAVPRELAGWTTCLGSRWWAGFRFGATFPALSDFPFSLWNQCGCAVKGFGASPVFRGNVLEAPWCDGWCLQGLRGEQTWNEGKFCPSELECTKLPCLIPEPELLPMLNAHGAVVTAGKSLKCF